MHNVFQGHRSRRGPHSCHHRCRSNYRLKHNLLMLIVSLSPPNRTQNFCVFCRLSPRPREPLPCTSAGLHLGYSGLLSQIVRCNFQLSNYSFFVAREGTFAARCKKESFTSSRKLSCRCSRGFSRRRFSCCSCTDIKIASAASNTVNSYARPALYVSFLRIVW